MNILTGKYEEKTCLRRIQYGVKGVCHQTQLSD